MKISTIKNDQTNFGINLKISKRVANYFNKHNKGVESIEELKAFAKTLKPENTVELKLISDKYHPQYKNLQFSIDEILLSEYKKIKKPNGAHAIWQVDLPKYNASCNCDVKLLKDQLRRLSNIILTGNKVSPLDPVGRTGKPVQIRVISFDRLKNMQKAFWHWQG